MHLWRLTLPASDTTPLDDLPESDRVRAAGYASSERAAGFVAGRRALRVVLGGYLQAAPTSFELWAERHQKPRLTDTGPQDLRFNMAHRAGRALVAVASGFEVGVDLEANRTVAESEAIAVTVLTSAERAALDGSAADTRHTSILRAWVRREAVLKAVGTGLRIPPSSIDVGDASQAVARPVVAGGSTWALWDLIPWPDAVGALAAARTDVVLRRFTA